ncbi:inorganic phosphate transporter [Tenuifilum thalassicum]|uniref:Phosphate transporter n=1 Tax=Tenuifilum thalassicum TaxID=2590900 RepID=A0A7D4BE22_9BACT|nr:inorganic phosphate transporter [Tenuifilum thalassicum]QKG80303.1 inorganic phosphate transporter [Tenuifilum thalassicum]
METYYLIIVGVLFILAASDLIVGVSNDAVNFLNSAIGSKVAKRHWILLVASAGVLVGSVFSSGMMEVARKGVFYPQNFFFNEMMIIFLAVMITDVIVLDFFNTYGMPTSTTVSLVFELLGSAVAVSIYKIMGTEGETIAHLGKYINSGKALAIISGILSSVVVAFVVGMVVQYIARLLFSFNYQKNIKYVGSIWGGFAMSAITYFIVVKGLKGSSLVPADVLAYVQSHTSSIMLYSFIGWTLLLQLLHVLLKFNPLRFIVLTGTFALALAFAGNDLVNFIGVSMAGLKAYQIHLANPDIAPDALRMTDFAGKVSTNSIYLLIAGFVMIITLWLSRKARKVTETSVDLARQDVGIERFGSTQFSRIIVRIARRFAVMVDKITPAFIRKFVSKQFDTSKAPKYSNPKEAPAFDLVRASVNLVMASILISFATSLKLPLSTTYVTFMVAMGTSLSDKAWGRESAVYRITGVITVIAGWFFTAFITFTIAFLIATALYYGKIPAFIILILVAFGLIIKSNFLNRKKEEAEELDEEINDQSIVIKCSNDLRKYLKDSIKVFNRTVDGLTTENRKLLKEVNQEVSELNMEAKNMKYNVFNVLKQLEADSIETGHYYVQVIDYLRELAHSLEFISNPSLQHVENQHKGLTLEQANELKSLSVQLSGLFDDILAMIKNNDYTSVPDAIEKQQEILNNLNKIRKKQVKRIKRGETGTRNSVLYLGLLNEIKNLLLHTINILKSQRDFILNNIE